MPNYHPIKPPSLDDPGYLKKRFEVLGISWRQFGAYVRAGLPIASIRLLLKKPDDTYYSRDTVSKWVKAYKAQRKG